MQLHRGSRGRRHLSPPGSASAAHHRGRPLPVVSVPCPPHPSASAATPEQVRQVSGGPRPWQRPERNSHSVPAPFRSEAGPAGSPGPGDARGGAAAAAAAVPLRSQPGPSPGFSRVTFRARAQPITRRGASVAGSLFPPANRWAGKTAAAPPGVGPKGEAARSLPFYWAEAALLLPVGALIGPTRRGRGRRGWCARAGLARCVCGRVARANPVAAPRRWRARRVKGAAWRWHRGPGSFPGGGRALVFPLPGPCPQRRTGLGASLRAGLTPRELPPPPRAPRGGAAVMALAGPPGETPQPAAVAVAVRLRKLYRYEHRSAGVRSGPETLSRSSTREL